MLRKIKFVAAIVALMVLIVLCQAGGGLLKKGFMKVRRRRLQRDEEGLLSLTPVMEESMAGRKG